MLYLAKLTFKTKDKSKILPTNLNSRNIVPMSPFYGIYKGKSSFWTDNQRREAGMNVKYTVACRARIK